MITRTLRNGLQLWKHSTMLWKWSYQDILHLGHHGQYFGEGKSGTSPKENQHHHSLSVVPAIKLAWTGFELAATLLDRRLGLELLYRIILFLIGVFWLWRNLYPPSPGRGSHYHREKNNRVIGCESIRWNPINLLIFTKLLLNFNWCLNSQTNLINHLSGFPLDFIRQSIILLQRIKTTHVNKLLTTRRCADTIDLLFRDVSPALLTTDLNNILSVQSLEGGVLRVYM